MNVQLLREEDVRPGECTEEMEGTVGIEGTEGKEVTVGATVVEYEEIIKEVKAIMQKRGFKVLEGQDVQGDISRFYIKGDTLIELIVTPWADEEVLEMICQGAE